MLDSQYSLLIPTYNRPHHLQRLLAFFEGKGVTFAIHVMDGSNAECWEINQKICASANLNIKHRHFPDDLPLDRILSILPEIQTDYISMCGDDDVLVVESLPEMVRFLDENRDYVACHGQYFNFREEKKAEGDNPEMHLLQVEYVTPSLVGETALERITEQMTDYESPYYAVTRTAVCGELIRSWLPDSEPMFIELFQANGLAVMGKIERQMTPYLFRNSGLGPNETKHADPFNWLAENVEDLILHYLEYRNRLVRMIKQVADPGLPDAAIKQSLDLAHSIYLASGFNEGLAYKGIETALALPEAQWRKTMDSVESRIPRARRQKGASVSATMALTEGREWDFKIDKAIVDCMGVHQIRPFLEILIPYYPKPEG